MKNLAVCMAMIAVLVMSTMAQSFRDEELSTEFVFLKRNVTIAEVQTGNVLRFDKLSDSYGFRIGYGHFFGRKGGRGDLGIGVEGGATFHDVNNSTVALARAQYKLVWQANGNKKWKPFVKGTIGGARESLKANVACPTGGGGFALCSPEWSVTYGGGAGFDIGSGRRRFRVGVEYFSTGFRDQTQHNLEASAGIVW